MQSGEIIKRLSDEEYKALDLEQKKQYLAPCLKQLADRVNTQERDKFTSEWAFRNGYNKRTLDAYLKGKVENINNVVVGKNLLDDMETFINELDAAA